MRVLAAKLTSKANVPLLLITYAGLVAAVLVEFPIMGDGASWTIGAQPTPHAIAWEIAFPCALAAFGISVLLNRASATIERQHATVAPWYVRLFNVVTSPAYFIAYLFRSNGPEMRLAFGCAILALFVWIVAWPAYIVRSYG